MVLTIARNCKVLALFSFASRRWPLYSAEKSSFVRILAPDKQMQLLKMSNRWTISCLILVPCSEHREYFNSYWIHFWNRQMLKIGTCHWFQNIVFNGHHFLRISSLSISLTQWSNRNCENLGNGMIGNQSRRRFIMKGGQNVFHAAS